MNRRLLYVGVLIACGLAWGSTQTLGKLAVSTGYRHFGLLFWQFAIGAGLLGLILAQQRALPRLTQARLGFALLLAVIGTIIPGTTFYLSVTQLPAGIMSILISTVPMLSFPIALALGMDRFSALRLAGLLCGLAGVVLMQARGHRTATGRSAPALGLPWRWSARSSMRSRPMSSPASGRRA